MRRLHITLVMSLLLLFVQQGAVLHELSHVVRVDHADVSVHADIFVEKTCALCLGYSQLANPVSHSVPPPSLTPVSCAPGTDACYSVTLADVPTPRNRGPPRPS